MKGSKDISRDNKQTPTYFHLDNVDVSTEDLYEAMGDVTKQFFKLNKLFKKIDMNEGGKHQILFSKNQA